MLLVLGASVPVLAGNALRVGIDAGLAGGEVAEDFDGIIDASLVGVNIVESYRREKRKSKQWEESILLFLVLLEGLTRLNKHLRSVRHLIVNLDRCKDILSPGCEAELTAAPVRVAELDVAAGAGRVLPGSLRSEQVLNLCVQ